MSNVYLKIIIPSNNKKEWSRCASILYSHTGGYKQVSWLKVQQLSSPRSNLNNYMRVVKRIVQPIWILFQGRPWAIVSGPKNLGHEYTFCQLYHRLINLILSKSVQILMNCTTTGRLGLKVKVVTRTIQKSGARNNHFSNVQIIIRIKAISLKLYHKMLCSTEGRQR